MKRFFVILLTLCLAFGFSSCGTLTDGAQTPATEPEPTSEPMPTAASPSAEELYEEAAAFLDAQQYKEAYEKLLEAAQAGSAEAMEKLARGIILDMTFSAYTAEDSQRLVELCKQKAAEEDPWAILALAYCYMSGYGSEEENRDTFNTLEKAAATDNPEVQALALNDMGYLLSNGIFVARDGKKAAEAYKKAAELGNAYAMGNLGAAYAYGTLFEQNDAAAISWFEKALQAGDGAARDWAVSMLNGLGDGYLFPQDGVEPDYERAQLYYGLSAENGDKDALFYLAVMYHQGLGRDRDMTTALEYYEKAVDAGSAAAAYNLALAYTYGEEGVEQDLDKGLEYFSQSVKLGNPAAADTMNDIAVNLRNGKGFRLDRNLAMTWYEKAAEAGSTVAMNNLASIYLYYPMPGIDRDFDKALSYYEKAARLGDEEAVVRIYNMAATLLKGGGGIPKDPAEAVKWFEKAGELGNDQAMRTMGILYLSDAYSDILEQDRSKAIEWFEKAANAGNVDSMEKLGSLFAASGNDTDYEKALDWYSMAADNCDPQDTLTIKRIASYVNNIGVLCSVETRADYDPELAFRAFNTAAMLGDQSAMYNLGKAYVIGYGTEADAERGNQLLGGIRNDKEAFLSSNGWFTSDPG